MRDLGEIFSREQMNERQIKLYETLVFFVKLLSVGLIFQAILYIYPDTSGIQAWMAQLIALLVNPIMADSFVAQGIDIATKGEIYVITQDCLGWKSMAAFIALVFASSENLLKHRKALIAGVAVIFVANIVRIVTTVFLAHQGIISFDIIHDIFWKWSLTLLVFTLWISWFEGIVTEEKIMGMKESILS